MGASNWSGDNERVEATEICILYAELLLKVIQGHRVRCSGKPIRDFIIENNTDWRTYCLERLHDTSPIANLLVKFSMSTQ